MSIVPNTTCRRCHRQYPSYKSRCPYCGTKKEKQVRSPVPETDSAVPGTQASKNAAETMNLQMLMGTVLLLAVIVIALVMVTFNVGRDATDRADVEKQIQDEIQTTALPLPTPTPTPSPSPLPALSDLECTSPIADNEIDYIDTGYFGLPSGSSMQLKLTWYPGNVPAVPEWSVEDESVLKITPSEDGQTCECEFVGEPDTETVLHIKVNEREESIQVLCS